MTDSKSTGKRVQLSKRLRWVPITAMRVSPQAQREVNPARVAKIHAELDIEQIGNPTVSERDGHYWVIDGQHRIEALRAFGFGDDLLQCWVYTGMSEEQEAEMFLKLNDTLHVDVFSKFRIAVKSGRPEQCEINRVVLAQDLRVSRDKVDGAIRAVGTLQRVYRRSDSATLGRTLRILRDSWGDAGLEALTIDGLGYVTARYNGQLDDEDAVTKLSRVRGGAAGVLSQAEIAHRRTGAARAQCVAATIVDVVNKGRRGAAKLESWWSE